METWCQATRCTCRRKFLRKQLVLPRSFEAHSTSSSLDADEPTVREDGQVWAFLMNEGWTFKESPNSNEWWYLKEDQSAYWKTRQEVVGTFERDDTDTNLQWISIVLFFLLCYWPCCHFQLYANFDAPSSYGPRSATDLDDYATSSKTVNMYLREQ